MGTLPHFPTTKVSDDFKRLQAKQSQTMSIMVSSKMIVIIKQFLLQQESLRNLLHFRLVQAYLILIKLLSFVTAFCLSF